MAYFPNGTTGDRAQEDYCDRCVHWSEEDSCPVWDLHQGIPLMVSLPVLNILWPMRPDGLEYGDCAMFHAKPESTTSEVT